MQEDGDLVIPACDLAREELGGLAAPHWSVPGPVPAGHPDSFGAALDELGRRVRHLAPRLAAGPAAGKAGIPARLAARRTVIAAAICRSVPARPSPRLDGPPSGRVRPARYFIS